jgi:hypothetical protein
MGLLYLLSSSRHTQILGSGRTFVRTYRPAALPANNKAVVVPCNNFLLLNKFTIITTHQKLMFPIKFPYLLLACV